MGDIKIDFVLGMVSTQKNKKNSGIFHYGWGCGVDFPLRKDKTK